jgi:hypothetical protein
MDGEMARQLLPVWQTWMLADRTSKNLRKIVAAILRAKQILAVKILTNLSTADRIRSLLNHSRGGRIDVNEGFHMSKLITALVSGLFVAGAFAQAAAPAAPAKPAAAAAAPAAAPAAKAEAKVEKKEDKKAMAKAEKKEKKAAKKKAKMEKKA